MESRPATPHPALCLVSRGPPGFSPGVRWLDSIERRMEWISFPGLFKYLTFLGVIAFACQWARPDIADLLEYDGEAVFQRKEIWRIFTFVFAPLGMQSFTAVGAFFLFFAVQLSFLISDSLEGAWGATRTTLYILVGWFFMACLNILVGFGVAGAGISLYTSVFFAFATLFPKYELLLFFLIPVQVRILAGITAVILVLKVLMNTYFLMLIIPGLIPYLLWVLPDVIHGRKSLVAAAHRRRKFNVSKLPEAVPFHKCEVCQRTERDPADLEFFVMPDGKEYCSEHLPPQS